MLQYSTEQFLPVDIIKAWIFFTSPANLALITPPALGFKILTNLNGDEIAEGMKIDYTVKPIMGIPLHWQTVIGKVQKHKFFTDKQQKGPYKIWEHTHTFTEKNGGILMKDIVNYKLPLGWFGALAHLLFVRKKLEAIFAYRKLALEKLFL